METVILENFSNYIINNSGDNYKTVWSKRSNKWLKPIDNGDGHLKISMTNDKGVKKKCFIHRLIAKSFIPNPNNFEYIHHINHNPKDNRIENLEWISPEKHTSIHNKGNKNFLGKHHTEDYKQKMSNRMKGDKNPMYGKERPKGSGVQPKRVFQYTLDGNLVRIWKSTMDCNEKYERRAVSKCCNNKYIREGNNIYKGYRWSFKPL